MGKGRKVESVTVQEKLLKQFTPNIQPSSARNLRKSELAGLIFACKHSTYKECMSKLLFGLPSAHIAYVQHVTIGMPLFLFNCSDRKLHGIYEAASSGKLEIDKKAWTSEDSELTPFPAQARVKIQMYCQPLFEDQYKPILANNYRHSSDPNFFWFELDKGQTQKLISLFSASPIKRSLLKPQVKWGTPFKKSVDAISRQGSCSKAANGSSRMLGTLLNPSIGEGSTSTYDAGKPWSSLFKSQEQDLVPKEKSEKSDNESLYRMSEDEFPESPDAICVNVQSLDIATTSQPLLSETFIGDTPLDMPSDGWVSEIHPAVLSEANCSSDQDSSEVNSDIFAIFNKLLQTVGEIKALQLTQTQKIESLDLELAEVNNRLQKLESCSGGSGSSMCSSVTECCDSILIIGGFDGSVWLQDLVSYLPSEDLIQPLEPMSSVRPYTCAVERNGEIYIFGGGQDPHWYDTVESYNLKSQQWTSCPVLNSKKGSLAGASLFDKIFAIGGGNGFGCLSEVEMLDFNVGKWLVTRSMLHKRFAPAAAELNGVLYVAGGYDGQEYLRSVERFDPREHSWTQLKPLNSRRGCHSLTVLNDKLYAIGGYDGSHMVSTIEVYDPRVGSWTLSEPMTTARGYMGTATLGNTIYAIGGMLGNGEILNTVECYSDGEGWRLAESQSIGKKCFCSAVTCTL